MLGSCATVVKLRPGSVVGYFPKVVHYPKVGSLALAGATVHQVRENWGEREIERLYFLHKRWCNCC